LDTNTTNLANAAVKYDDPAVKDRITLGNAGTPVAIGNVANGVAATDAVNVSQLDAVSQTANKGWNLSTNKGASTSNIAPGGTVDLSNTDGNVVIGQSGPNATFDLASNVKIANSLSVGAVTIDTTSVVVGASKLDATGLTITGGPSVTTAGVDAGGKKITNVANGDVTATSTDAVNGSQLFAVVGNATANAVQYDDATKTKITLGGAGATQPTQITNLANGAVAAGSTDAVNGSQLYDVQQTANMGWNLTANGANSSNVAPGSTVDLNNTDGNLAITKTGNAVTFNLSKDVTVDSVTSGNSKLDTSGLTIAGGPSVTTAGIDAGNKAITNVAAGTNATDAVNLSQLNSVSTSVTNLGNNVNNLGNSTASTIGGGTTYDPNTGTLSGFSQNVTAVDGKGNAAGAPTQYTTVSNALTQLDTNTTNLANAAVKYDDPAIKDKITLGGIGASDLTLITNLAKGNISATSSDAVNGSQLYAASNSIADNFGGGSVVNPDGTVSAPNYNIGGNTYNDVGSALNAVSSTASAGWNLSTGGDTAGKSNVGPGGTVDLSNTDGNIVVAHNGSNATFDLAKSITLDSVTAGGNTLDATGLTVGNTTVTTDGLTITGGPSVTTAGIDAGNKKVTNLADGSDPNDAVNFSQLNTVATSVTNLGNNVNNLGSTTASTLGGGASYDPATGKIANFSQNVTAVDGKGNVGASTAYTTVAGALTQLDTNTTNLANVAVKYDDPATKDKITLGNAGTPVTIGNVANGVAANDAVNVSQLQAVGNNANAGWNLSTGGDTAGKSNVGPGGTVDLSNTDGNIVIAHNGPNATFDLAKSITLDSITAGGNTLDATGLTVGGTTVTTNGLTITGGPSVTTAGIDAGSKAITNVAAGTNATDAVNVGQLQTVSNAAGNLGNSTASTLGGGTTYDPATGTLSGFSQTVTAIDGKGNVGTTTGYTTVAGALTQLDTNTTNLANAAVKYDDPAVKDKITLGNAGTPVTMTNLANGAVTAVSSDAVNGSQLYAVQQTANKGWNLSTNNGSTTANVAPGGTVDLNNTDGNIVISQSGSNATFNLASAITVATLTANSVTTGNATLDTNGLTITGGPSVTTNGIDAGGKKITNIAKGDVSSTSTDAVNGSQLFSLGNSVASGLGGGSSFDPSSGTVITSLNYGGSTFTSVQSVLDKIGGSINGGGIKYFHANSTEADSVASGDGAVAIGPKSVASGAKSIAAGNDANAGGASSVAVGNGAEASGNDSIATGTQAKASGEGAIATGKNAEASGTGSTAMGSGSKATADGATAVGANSSATTANSTAIGNGAQASANEGDVALGAGSVTSTVINTTGTTINGTPYTFAGTNATSTVSVGSAGNERTVTNVAAGQISATSTDAVNGSQLYATNQAIEAANQQVTQLGNNVNNLGTSTATTIGGGATYNSTTGKIENFSQGVTKIDKNGDVDANGPTQYSSVSDAMTQLDQNTTNLANTAVKYDDPSKTSVTLGNAGTPVTINNVANGEVSGASKQAVNGSQLYGTASSVAAALGGNTTVDANGQLTGTKYQLSTGTYNDVGSALTALDKRFDGIGGSIANLQSQVSNNLKEARQGISQAMAASALRYDDRPGKVSAAAGMAVYHRQVGLAAGLGWTSEDAKWRANIAGTYSAGGRKPDFGVMGGLSYTFN
ncbi:beta strand repeat-containing protein, partial [Labrys sp. (in: a-proteobacteria)]|uniref:beta strand repeat-containing protein n=1 Tax=Labrys sp. (in: a-proteobacteria) TaxID=1917972 RepID=UPI0039E5E5D0